MKATESVHDAAHPRDFPVSAIEFVSSVGWLVGFVALCPTSTAMVIAGRSVHLTTLFPGQT